MRCGIDAPSTQAQEELKYLICLDYKYLEMLMLIKLTKIMQDLEFTGHDLRRKAKDPGMESVREIALAELRQARQAHLSQYKAAKSVPAPSTVQGVSQSTQQEKKRKRPDDKVSKKAGNRPTSAAPNKVAARQQAPVDFLRIDDIEDDDIQKVSGPLIEDNYLDEDVDEVDIPIDDDDEEPMEDIEEDLGAAYRARPSVAEEIVDEIDYEADGRLLHKKASYVHLRTGDIDEDIDEVADTGHGYGRIQTNMPD